MPVNETLAHYSTWCYGSAVGVYVLAMLFCLAEGAFSKVRQKSAAQSRELVGAGGPSVTEPTPPTPAAPRYGRTVEAPRRPLPERLGRMGVSLIILALGLHLVAIVLRGLATHRAPWGNMYEYVSVLCFAAIAAWVVLMAKFPIRRATGFVLVPVVILMFLGGTVLYTQAEPVEPALQSYWLAVHVTIVSVATGVLLIPGVASLLYLFRSAHDRNPARFARFAPKLPTSDTLDRLAYRTTVFGLPLFTLGVICGAIWADSAWGHYWQWDPKETTAFVAWVVYAAYLHSRATAGWRGTRAAVINVVGLAVMLFNLFFINLVVTGLHSYAGVG
ncbi:MAG TPA: c-type cytochrome biogenesis protein CcsB [Pseudonocardiaceae bacterium]|jgi:cytochrome c-type biogenesis protein CcsB|nr:c-type cytochrome biogenesis protein CcsB [Pseudonocardiaceae bacterium]